MARGRKPKPSHLLKLAGNPGKRPLNEREPKPELGFPACPERLKGAAREAWERFSQIQKNEHKKLVALLCEFGMTPSSRSRVQAVPRSDALDEFLRSYPA